MFKSCCSHCFIAFPPPWKLSFKRRNFGVSSNWSNTTGVMYWCLTFGFSIVHLWFDDSADMLFRYIIAGIFGILGLWNILANYVLIWKCYINNYHSSKIPLLGGMFLCTALFLIPHNSFDWWLYLLVLIIDIGCLPLLISTVIFFILGKHKN